MSPCLDSESLLSISEVRPLELGSGDNRNFKRGKRGKRKREKREEKREERRREGRRERREKFHLVSPVTHGTIKIMRYKII